MQEYLDIEQSFFVWPRADRGYYWDEQARPGGLFGEMIENPPRPEPPYLLETPETTGFYTTRVMEQEPALFLKFADIQPTREGILEFANAYGPLTHGETEVLTPRYSYPEGREEEKPWKHGVFGLCDQKDGRIYGTVFADSLKFWQNEIRDMRWTVQVWEWFEKRDAVALERVIHWSKDGQGVSYVLADWEGLSDATVKGDIMDQIKAARIPFSTGPLASKDYHGEVLARFRPGDVLLPAQYLVQSRINEKLQKLVIRPRLLMNDHNQLEPYLCPKNLLAAMWFQFFRTATGEKRFRRCSICGLWADVTGKTQRWSRHADCANRERVRRSRAKAQNSGHKMATRSS
ncbi:MAG: hypothetical protein DDT21_02731 [Syntrophomonadaceae bacterium]|nr:hypothetical protein [Bacillota bacterium]